MHQGRMFSHPVEVDALAAARGRSGPRRARPPRSPGAPARPCGRTTAARSAARSARRSGARTARSARTAPRRAADPRSRSAATTASARLRDGQAREPLPGLVGHPAVLADHDDLLETVLRARSRSRSGRGPGVILSAPVPNSGSTCSSAMIGSRRPTSGRIAVPADEVAVALVVRVHRDGGVGEHRLRAGRWRPSGPRRSPRADSRSRRACPSTSRFSTSRSEIAEREPGSQLTM